MDPWNNSQAGQIYDINTNHEDYFSNEHPLTCPPTEGYIENSVKKNSIPSLLSLPFDPNSLSTYQSPPFLNTNFQSEVNSLPSSGHNAPPDPSSFLTIANGQYRCNLCAVSVCGPEPYKQHIAGRKHQFNVSEALAQSNSAIDCPNSSHYSELVPVPYDPRTDPGLKFAEELVATCGPNAFIPEQLLFCSPCKLQMPSLYLYRSHLYSAEHIAAIDRTLLAKGQRADLVHSDAQPLAVASYASAYGPPAPKVPKLGSKPSQSYGVSAATAGPSRGASVSSLRVRPLLQLRPFAEQQREQQQQTASSGDGIGIGADDSVVEYTSAELPPPPPLPSLLKMLVSARPAAAGAAAGASSSSSTDKTSSPASAPSVPLSISSSISSSSSSSSSMTTASRVVAATGEPAAAAVADAAPAENEKQFENELIARTVRDTPKPEHVYPEPIPSRYVFAAGPMLQGLAHHIAEVESNPSCRITLERHRAPPSPPRQKRANNAGARASKRGGRGAPRTRATARGWPGRGGGFEGSFNPYEAPAFIEEPVPVPEFDTGGWPGRGAGFVGNFNPYEAPAFIEEPVPVPQFNTVTSGMPMRGRGLPMRGRGPSGRGSQRGVGAPNLRRGAPAFGPVTSQSSSGCGMPTPEASSAFPFGPEQEYFASLQSCRPPGPEPLPFGPEQEYFASLQESGAAGPPPAEYEYNSQFEYYETGGGIPEVNDYGCYPGAAPSQCEPFICNPTSAYPNDGVSNNGEFDGQYSGEEYTRQQYSEPFPGDNFAAPIDQQADSDWRAQAMQYNNSYASSETIPNSESSTITQLHVATRPMTALISASVPTPAVPFSSATAANNPPAMNFFMQAALRAAAASISTTNTIPTIAQSVRLAAPSRLTTPQPVPPPPALAAGASRPGGFEWAPPPPPPPPFNSPPRPPPPPPYPI